MKEKEDFNKLCADFLNWKPCLTHEFDRYGYCQTVDGYITKFNNIISNAQLIEYNSSIYEYSISDLQFHSDWNWIMLVVENIEKLPNLSVYFRKTSIGEYDIEISIEFPTYNIFKKNDKTFSSSGSNKKDVLVETIYQFLVWYKENKNDNK